MKKIFILLFIVFVALKLEAQLVYDKWGNIIPFSSSEKYSVEIEAYNIPSFVIPYMDNDSLSKKFNNGKSLEELGAEYTGGIELRHEPISLKENGICINLEHGKLWRYAIEGVTARGIGVDLGFPKLPKGTYIALIASDTAVNLIQPPMVFHSENLLERHKKRGIRSSVYGEKIIIEYYEPNVLKEKEDIVIKRISYGFVGFGNQRRSSLNDLDLKSGYWGSSEYSGCQNDIVCTDYGNYKNEAKSVVFLDIEFKIDEDGDGYFETKYKNGTGFFLNKAGDYDVNDFPLLVTAGHLYNYEKLGVTPIDIISDITHFYVITKYENKECGTDNTDNKGIQLPGFFNRIALGSSYDEAGLPGYSPNHDYAVLQATSNIDRFADYDLEYGAWYKDHDFYNSSNVGYFCIHHPKGDVKKINKDNHSADLVTFDGFQLKYDLGLTEKGSSGAPVFNSSRQIVGFHVAGASEKSCDLIGQMTSTNGTFNNLYFEISSIIDPNGAGEANSSNPSPPDPSELPDHCDNCIQDGDETGIDCGGSCYPCGIRDVLAIKSDLDLLGEKKSRYEIFAEPDPGTLLALKSGNSSLEAGMNIYLNGGFEVQKGATFYAGIEPELMSEPDRGCGNYCANAPDVQLTPDGDGINDYYAFSQAFAVEYDLRIFDRNNNTYYTSNNRPIYENGWIIAWDGTGAVPNVQTYYGTLILTDCNGVSHQENFYMSVYTNKSAIIISDETNNKTVSKNQGLEIDTRKGGLIVYPNPFLNKLTINYSGKTFPLKYKITDLSGRVVIEKETHNTNELINLSGLATGTYVINARAGEYNLVQKLIKK